VGFLLLAVLLSVVRLFWASARSPTALPSGSFVEHSAEATALIEELRLLRTDISKLKTVLEEAETSAGVVAHAPGAAKTETALVAAAPARPVAPAMSIALTTSAHGLGKRDGVVLMAVITNPSHIKERAELRAFYRDRFPTEQGKVRVVFVMGNNYFLGNPPKPLSAETKQLLKVVMAESKEQGDIVWVDGREALPHVGKATEKSAAWWQTAPSLGNYGYYCKSDDDSLIHLSRLRRDLEDAGESSLYGYVAFRGWKPNYKFQACGIDVRPSFVEQALQGKDFARDENCTDSVGPFPYAGGNLVCMGQVLANTLAHDGHFNAFVRKAHERNDGGIACKSPLECAKQPWEAHMWHHEDAGISYNLFRSVVRAGLKDIKVVKIQPWVHIQHWLRDNITEPIPLVVIHNLKGLKQLQSVIGEWRMDVGPWEFESERALCQPCSKIWSWNWARSCASGEGDACDEMVVFDPNSVYTCCMKGYPQAVMLRMNDEERVRALKDREARSKKEAADKEQRAAKAKAILAAKASRELVTAGKQATAEKAALENLKIGLPAFVAPA